MRQSLAPLPNPLPEYRGEGVRVILLACGPPPITMSHMTLTVDPPPAARVVAARPTDAAARYASVDALRGVVMFVMLYVNDVAGVRHIPWWMKHYDETGSNGMTFVDWVFGGFLFIVGMSIPLA